MGGPIERSRYGLAVPPVIVIATSTMIAPISGNASAPNRLVRGLAGSGRRDHISAGDGQGAEECAGTSGGHEAGDDANGQGDPLADHRCAVDSRLPGGGVCEHDQRLPSLPVTTQHGRWILCGGLASGKSQVRSSSLTPGSDHRCRRHRSHTPRTRRRGLCGAVALLAAGDGGRSCRPVRPRQPSFSPIPPSWDIWRR